MNDIKYYQFRSKNNTNRVIEIGEYPNGVYFIPAAVGIMSDNDNQFMSIEEIELFIDDQLELMVPKND